MTSVIQSLKRTKTKPLDLGDNLKVEIKCLSLGTLEDLQEKVKALEGNEDPKQQFLPILQAGVVGLEEVTAADLRDFLLEDLQTIAEKVMEVGK